MYCRHILLLRRDLQCLVECSLINDAILRQSGVHIQYNVFALPGVALGMRVDGLVAIQYLRNSLLAGHLQNILCVTESVDDADFLWTTGQPPNQVFLVLPPGDCHGVILQSQVQVLAFWCIELTLARLISTFLRRLGFVVEPARDVRACHCNQGINMRVKTMQLYKGSQVIDILKEADPYVVGGVVQEQLFLRVVAPLLVRCWEVFGESCSCIFRQHYY